ncbi:MAG: hypothetical protein EWV82_08090 [Microcystis aeruginosa Ma_AC_P_19900807_S299]|jgi:molecular chaperone DnaK (HSP70)|uniref:Hsp70 family protein n=1 Tax=Microcystis aeruginosa Ma_SC_T_19800800_S464 TaxID=2486257 RepID=A0A552E398_MICAE|nr:MAG: hypothetical protein EWV82_08090 [Microcystis aeruginosa Ma_AC_P_19900807_S299]TRU28934.1 MAG: hypothetical protein EWV81_03745 [Microcystis aeruginosa Ma_SC_T_19800800_S464]
MSNNHVEIIGFHLGNETTSLAKIKGDDPYPYPRNLLLHKKDCQPTMIAYHPEQGVLFGEQALNIRATDFQIPFKKHPTSDPNYQKVMRDYVNAIYQYLLQTEQLQKDDQNHFFISCPSEWTDAEVAEYQKLLESSNLPRVTVIKEGFAALMQARGSDLLTGEEIKGNVLVINVGLSTTACILVKAGIHDEDGDFGIDLDASLIDKAILDYSLSQNEDREAIEKAFKTAPFWRERCESKCRRAKEEYFSDPHRYEDEDSEEFSGEKIRYLGIDIGIFEPIVYKSIMEKILNQPLPELGNQSWIDSFHNFIFNINEELEKQEIKLSSILLTGGASKMDFIPEIVHKIFSNCKCTRDIEPGLCIAMGLARWGEKINQDMIHIGIGAISGGAAGTLAGSVGTVVGAGIGAGVGLASITQKEMITHKKTQAVHTPAIQRSKAQDAIAWSVIYGGSAIVQMGVLAAAVSAGLLSPSLSRQVSLGTRNATGHSKNRAWNKYKETGDLFRAINYGFFSGT